MAHTLKKRGKGLVGMCLGYDSRNMTGRKGWALIKGDKYKTCDDCDLGETHETSWREIKNFCGLAIGNEVATGAGFEGTESFTDTEFEGLI